MLQFSIFKSEIKSDEQSRALEVTYNGGVDIAGGVKASRIWIIQNPENLIQLNNQIGEHSVSDKIK